MVMMSTDQLPMVAGPPKDMNGMSQLEQVREMARLRQNGQAMPAQGIPMDPGMNNMYGQPVVYGGQPQMGQPGQPFNGQQQ